MDQSDSSAAGLVPVPPRTLRASERFSGLDATVEDFWSWAYSDLRSNVVRSAVAEFLVAVAVGADRSSPRDSWGNYDVSTPGGVCVEVKSSGYLQSWWQRRLSQIGFSRLIGREFDATTGLLSGDQRVRCDVYVFAVQICEVPAQYDVLDPGQWRFYVVGAERVDPAAITRNVSLAWVKRQASAGPIELGDLADEIGAAAPDHPQRSGYPDFELGDGAALTARLIELVLSGSKTATSSLLAAWEAERSEIPEPGSRWALIDGDGVEHGVVQTTAVRVVRLADVDAAFARDEGEGYSGVADWRGAHERFWRKHDPDVPLDDETLIVCQHFRLIENAPADSGGSKLH